MKIFKEAFGNFSNSNVAKYKVKTPVDAKKINKSLENLKSTLSNYYDSADEMLKNEFSALDANLKTYDKYESLKKLPRYQKLKKYTDDIKTQIDELTKIKSEFETKKPTAITIGNKSDQLIVAPLHVLIHKRLDLAAKNAENAEKATVAAATAATPTPAAATPTPAAATPTPAAATPAAATPTPAAATPTPAAATPTPAAATPTPAAATPIASVDLDTKKRLFEKPVFKQIVNNYDAYKKAVASNKNITTSPKIKELNDVNVIKPFNKQVQLLLQDFGGKIQTKQVDSLINEYKKSNIQNS